nr:iron chelate uptake ABC transporter family permease subunit [Klebsiella pneumoniae]
MWQVRWRLSACWCHIWRASGQASISATTAGEHAAGATLMLMADVLARALAFPGDLPAGAVLALIGSPCFVWLVRRRG